MSGMKESNKDRHVHIGSSLEGVLFASKRSTCSLEFGIIKLHLCSLKIMNVNVFYILQRYINVNLHLH